MRSFAMTLGLKRDPGVADRYREHHRAVWPGVLEVLRETGIMKMRIYLHGHRLFMYMEAADDFDPVQDFARYADDPRGREWDKLMCGFQERVPGAASGEWWAAMEEVFDLDRQ